MDDKFWEVYARVLAEIFGQSEWTIQTQLMEAGRARRAQESGQYESMGFWDDGPYWLAADVTCNSDVCITQHLDKYNEIVGAVGWRAN